MSRITDGLEQIAEKVRLSFSNKDVAREKGLRLSREVIRNSSDAIRAVHRQEYDKAEELLSQAGANLREMDQTVSQHADLLYSGFVHNAQKEFAEGQITLALVTGKAIPEPDTLAVSHAAYLNGLGEAVGELRRHILDSVRGGDLSSCEEWLAIMDDIYSLLVTMDFPEALTFGLRRTTDVVRGILEKTRGDLTLAIRHRELERKLEILEQKKPRTYRST